MLNGIYDNQRTGHREEYLNGVLICRAGWVTLRCRPWRYYNDVPKGTIVRIDPNWRESLQPGDNVIWPGDKRSHVVLTVDRDAGTATLRRTCDDDDEDHIVADIAELE